ncbi:gamma-tubulin complex DGRIP91/SPC98 component [Schizopora paradoxa]|uniref:Gamma-tubulin complex DGRIP91/SPC98 component n=1 Tax=Schizopora paradoxa TaxID=27342 RepID=A0A0H2SRN8_9AGAM|nr:gamma-tubulin complex DGRIP91/SPC98 component [Schizopora paradoxa]
MSSSSLIPNLIQNLVPESRNDAQLKEDLVEQCTLILRSHLGNKKEPDFSQSMDATRRHLRQHAQSTTTLPRFTNLASRLKEQPAVSRKAAMLQFLNAVAAGVETSPTPAFIPTFAPPKIARPLSKLAGAKKDDVPPATPSSGKSKAEILRLYRAKLGKPHLSEEALLRDALYILQGISGKYVHFVEGNGEGVESSLEFVEDPEFVISNPNRTLIHRLAELGHLYIRIAAFVRPSEVKAMAGAIEQSLCHYMETQLTEYYRLIAVLESQMHISSGDKESGDGDVGTGLTLKRLDVWVDEWRLRLRMMSVCIEGCRDVNGGALVNLIHSYTNNGDPFIQQFTDELLEEVSKPFFAMLHKWLFSGELYDPHSEFFVAVDPELADVQYLQPRHGLSSGDDGFSDQMIDLDDLSREHQSGQKLWESKFIFRKEMLPAFVGETFGRKIFSTGKSLNFIRYSCHDSDWVATREKLAGTGSVLQYSDISGLERSIDSAYSIASQRLFDVFFDKFRLLDHLNALRHYLMLGYGDFADQLMEALGPSLSRPANTLYRHNLTATLETAIRSSNAQNDPPDVLRRLDARMEEYSHGEIGWDVFRLEYKVDAPIDTVLDSDTMIKYQKVFDHLWKTKRVEGSLSSGWMRVTGGSRTAFRVPGLDKEWHYVRIVLAEMTHFIRQIQSYCHLQIIECQWKKLMDFIDKKEGDLDALITAHRTYVGNVTRKVLVQRDKLGKEGSVFRSLQDLYTTILHFRTAMDDFYTYTMNEAARLDSAKDEARGIASNPSKARTNPATSKEALTRILSRIKEYGTSFSENAQNLVYALNAHEDMDCKNLSMRLSFSDYYRSKRESQAPHRTR